MEALGFIDSPGTASTWTTSVANSIPSKTSSNAPPLPTVDPFADWQPTEISARQLRGRVRWGLLAGMFLIAAGLTGIGFWIYQQPSTLAAEALTEVREDATALQPGLEALQGLNNDLLNQELTTSGVTSQLLAVASTARDLFSGSASLHSSDSITRTHAADAASDTLDASRLLGDAYAYRGVVIPILAVPDFETDRTLIALDEAARRFGEWQLNFDTVRSALPERALSAVTTQLDVISGDLDALQSRYLDALRQEDTARATAAVNDVNDRLRGAEAMLWSALSDVQAKVQVRIDEASSNIELLIG